MLLQQRVKPAKSRKPETTIKAEMANHKNKETPIPRPNPFWEKKRRRKDKQRYAECKWENRCRLNCGVRGLVDSDK